MKKILLGLVAGALFASGAFAQSDKMPSQVQLAITGGMKLDKSFPAGGGMTGWLLSAGPDNHVVVYTSANGEVAIAGSMLDAAGQNLTKKHIEQHATKPDYDKLWAELEKAPYVVEGAKGKDVKSTIYVFKDANCSYCHLEWKALQPYMKVGLQVRWVPVAFLAPDSYNKGAHLLTAKDAEEAVKELHANFGNRAAAPLPNPSPELRAKIEANNKLMQSWGFRGTPATFYKDKSGKTKAVNGMPSLSELPAITGLPAQANNDPDLARFR